MKPLAAVQRRPVGSILVWAASAVLVIGGSVAIAIGLHGHGVAILSPAPLGRTAAVPHTIPIPPVPRSRPIRLSIPALGLTTAVSTLGLNADGTVSVPTDVQEPGWYRLGPSPGQLGSSVILGHVDSFRGPAVFFYLRNLVVGDRVNVTLADGRMDRFAVIGTRMYLKTAFPDRLVYGRRHYAALQLVTCGGAFDPATGHYLSNVVIFTQLVSSQRASA